jgi:signal transduction histidine kinase
MMGLAQNAVQHTREGDPIEIGSTCDDHEARLWVADSGPGIAARDQERVFERFARASARARRSEGAGLGLAIVRAIAEAHGGRVELESRIGHGATFTLVLPLAGGGERAT